LSIQEHIPEYTPHTMNKKEYTRQINPSSINILHNIQNISQIIPFYIYNNNIDEFIHNWKGALAKIKHQGCALNLLNFYNLMDAEKSRTQIVCLSIKGTSIFKFMDYINEISNQNIQNAVIIRFKMEKLTQLLFNINYYFQANNIHNCVVFIKIYLTDTFINKKTNKEEVSDRGHFISFYFTNKNIILLDPQASIQVTLNDNNTQGDFLYNIYNQKYTVFDFICIPVLFNNIDFLYNISNEFYYIREKPEGILYGGYTNELMKYMDENKILNQDFILPKEFKKIKGGKPRNKRNTKRKNTKTKRNTKKNTKRKSNK
jgi:hypothetical protein